MTAAAWFWVIYVIFLIFGGVLYWPRRENYQLGGIGFIGLVLFGLLGWGVFGSPLK